MHIEEFIETRKQFDDLLLQAGSACTHLYDAKSYLASLQNPSAINVPAEQAEREKARFAERIQVLEGKVLDAGKQLHDFGEGLSVGAQR